MKPRQLLLVVLILSVTDFSAVTGQKKRGHFQPPKPQQRRSPEIESLVDQARVAPPEFAAAALIRIAQSSKVAKDTEWKCALLQDAFLLASKAQQPLIRRGLPASLVDTDSGYLARAFDLKLDALSMQCRIIKEILPVNRQMAREMFELMARPVIRPLSCKDPLVFDVAEYFETLQQVAQRGFTPEQMRRGEHIQLVTDRIRESTSSLQVGPAARMIVALKPDSSQLGLLVDAFVTSLEKVSDADRAFSFAISSASRDIWALVKSCEEQDSLQAALLAAYRRFLVRHSSGKRCGDNVGRKNPAVAEPAHISGFNRAFLAAAPPHSRAAQIEPISPDEIASATIDRRYETRPYWETPQAKQLLIGIKRLRFGSGNKELTLAERSESSWQQELNGFLSRLLDWDINHEGSEADYFHQRCVLFSGLIELLPAGPARESMVKEFTVFLSSSPMQNDSRIEWFMHVDSLLKRVDRDERIKVLGWLRDSNSVVLALQANLGQLLPGKQP
jgi:hypothetical protein